MVQGGVFVDVEVVRRGCPCRQLTSQEKRTFKDKLQSAILEAEEAELAAIREAAMQVCCGMRDCCSLQQRSWYRGLACTYGHRGKC
jgi:hypothetical protein